MKATNMVTILSTKKDASTGFDIRQYHAGRVSFVIYGWVSQYRKQETVHTILVKEIKKVKALLKKNKKDKTLPWLLRELHRKRVEESQLTLF